MTGQETPSGWPWGAPPFFALIRGPVGPSGFEVASIEAPGDSGSRTVLLFSCPEKAESYRRHRPRGHEDWQVGPLPDWERLAFFLRSLGSAVQFLSVDLRRPERDDDLDPGLEVQSPVESSSAPPDPSRGALYRVSLDSVLDALDSSDN